MPEHESLHIVESFSLHLFSLQQVVTAAYCLHNEVNRRSCKNVFRATPTRMQFFVNRHGNSGYLQGWWKRTLHIFRALNGQVIHSFSTLRVGLLLSAHSSLPLRKSKNIPPHLVVTYPLVVHNIILGAENVSFRLPCESLIVTILCTAIYSLGNTENHTASSLISIDE